MSETVWFHFESIKGYTLVHIGGVLDTHGAARLKEVVYTRLQEGESYFILDFEEVTDINSTAIGSLIFLRRSIGMKKGRLKLIGLGKNVRYTFEVLDLHIMFSLYPNLEEALIDETNEGEDV